MSEEKENGVNSTRDVKNTVGDKDISISNSSAGNNGHNGNGNDGLSPKALENYRKNKELRAKKSMYLNPDYFIEKKLLQFYPERIEPENEQKYTDKKTGQLTVNVAPLYTVTEPKGEEPEREKFWRVMSVKASKLIDMFLFEERKTLLWVQKTGSGYSTIYNIWPA
jgi:hypothetical protein